jgi:menaquinol-cytochrome c reductase iron-sulfur subunit
MSHNPKRQTTRSQFLSLATIGMGGTIAAVIGVPAVAYLGAPVLDKATFHPVPLGDVSEFTAQPGFPPKAAPYVEDPAEPQTSAGLAYVLTTGGKSRHWLNHDAMFVVFSNRCMHVGCPVAPTAVGFSCPCHGGQYDTDGRRIAGPPIRPLDRFQWEVRPGENGPKLWITQRWSVEIDGSKVNYFPVRAPGQPIDLPGPTFISDIAYPAVTYNQPSKPTK